MSDLLNYLKENLFDTQLKYLIKKLRDKKHAWQDFHVRYTDKAV